MDLFRFIKYPGSKSLVVPEILKVFKSSGKHILVDVFGGSGSVAFNAQARETVYNDLNKDLSELFKIVQNREPDLKILSHLFLESIDNKTRNHSAREKNRALRTYGPMVLEEMEATCSKRGIHDCNRITNALRTLYDLTISFGGMGDTYATVREKSAFKNLERTVSLLPEASHRMQNWHLGSLDFSEVFKIHDGDGAFFYLDPPYPGKDWYDQPFRAEDYKRLKGDMERTKGSFLLTLDLSDQSIQEIFGKPAFLKSYILRGSATNSQTPVKRHIAFYTNVRMASENS